jgi:DNA-binding XRE family transcriptional regulator
MITKPQKHTAKEIIAAIENTGGIKQRIAEKLGIHRHTLYKYEKQYPSVAQALKMEVEKIIDKAESNVFKSIQEGDIEDSWKLLRYRGKDRGYVEKSEHKVDEVRKIIFEDASKKDK